MSLNLTRIKHTEPQVWSNQTFFFIFSKSGSERGETIAFSLGHLSCTTAVNKLGITLQTVYAFHQCHIFLTKIYKESAVLYKDHSLLITNATFQI